MYYLVKRLIIVSSIHSRLFRNFFKSVKYFYLLFKCFLTKNKGKKNKRLLLINNVNAYGSICKIFLLLGNNLNSVDDVLGS